MLTHQGFIIILGSIFVSFMSASLVLPSYDCTHPETRSYHLMLDPVTNCQRQNTTMPAIESSKYSLLYIPAETIRESIQCSVQIQGRVEGCGWGSHGYPVLNSTINHKIILSRKECEDMHKDKTWSNGDITISNLKLGVLKSMQINLGIVNDGTCTDENTFTIHHEQYHDAYASLVVTALISQSQVTYDQWSSTYTVRNEFICHSDADVCANAKSESVFLHDPDIMHASSMCTSRLKFESKSLDHILHSGQYFSCKFDDNTLTGRTTSTYSTINRRKCLSTTFSHVWLCTDGPLSPSFNTIEELRELQDYTTTSLFHALIFQQQNLSHSVQHLDHKQSCLAKLRSLQQAFILTPSGKFIDGYLTLGIQGAVLTPEYESLILTQCTLVYTRFSPIQDVRDCLKVEHDNHVWCRNPITHLLTPPLDTLKENVSWSFGFSIQGLMYRYHDGELLIQALADRSNALDIQEDMMKDDSLGTMLYHTHEYSLQQHHYEALIKQYGNQIMSHKDEHLNNKNDVALVQNGTTWHETLLNSVHTGWTSASTWLSEKWDDIKFFGGYSLLALGILGLVVVGGLLGFRYLNHKWSNKNSTMTIRVMSSDTSTKIPVDSLQESCESSGVVDKEEHAAMNQTFDRNSILKYL